MTTTLTRPHNRLAPAAPQEHTLRDALLVTALALPTVVLATLGSIYILGEKKTPKEMRHVLAGLALVVIGGVMIGLNA